MTPLEAHLREAAALVEASRDIIEHRVDGPEPPEWCERRGWTDFLLGLSEPALERAEAEGLAQAAPALPGAPADLLALLAAVRSTTGRVRRGAAVVSRPLRGAGVRKAAQVAALVAIVRERFAGFRRIVDAGAGRGHLTRALAAALELPAIGLERDPARVAAAVAMTGEGGPRFETARLAPGSLRFAAGDLAIGLHACGALGDLLCVAVARDRVGLLLVNCCLQSIDTPVREPLSAQGKAAGLRLRRSELGLTNLISGRRLVEGDAARLVANRRTRYALRLLLRRRGLALAPGDELRGVPRRQVRHGLAVVATRACRQRQLAPPEPEELRALSAEAADAAPRIRRLELPRAALGRLLELAVVLDRARCLEEAGLQVALEAVFGVQHSPRNLGIIAHPGG